MSVNSGLPQEGNLTEWLLRAFAVLLYGTIISNLAANWWHEPSRWTLLLLFCTEGYTMVLILFAHRARNRDVSPLAIISVAYVVFFVALLEVEGTERFIPESAGIALLMLGIVLQLSAKITLGRCFGLLPASRGIVIAGPYCLVRHPIYASYLIGHIGFLLTNFSWRNAAVFSALYLVQVLRIQREEALLSASPEYRHYSTQVRWKLVPFVY